ncbi:MAG TPA: hypothetical protein DCE43_14830 [Planctomycetaceae bacterium]|nr:hypothetical protein [Planctomycetaceae bacterium]
MEWWQGIIACRKVRSMFGVDVGRKTGVLDGTPVWRGTLRSETALIAWRAMVVGGSVGIPVPVLQVVRSGL